MDKEKIEQAVREILIGIGENPEREGLKETPKRVANMYAELFSGMTRNYKEDVKVFQEEPSEDIVIVKEIPFYSMCEHHMLPFFGTASVAYLPQDGKVLGLSKVARIVDTCAKKLHLQERLCREIADAIQSSCQPKGVLVFLEAEHLCMAMRGIKKPGAKTTTLSTTGIFQQDAAYRTEILSLLTR